MWETLAAQTGPWGGWVLFGALGTYVCRQIIAGKLIPRSSHLREIGYKDATIAELKDQVKILAGSHDKVGPVS